LQIFDLFDVKKRGVIDFGDFVRALNVFHPNIPMEEKIDFSFKLYDMDNTGFIERKEVMSYYFWAYDSAYANCFLIRNLIKWLCQRYVLVVIQWFVSKLLYL
jgi:hypothetical protein